jgi:hypothetical protein
MHLVLKSVGAPAAAWPSLSQLAAALGQRPGRELSTLSRAVRAKGLHSRRLGRERRIAPPDAVRLLVDRGVPELRATRVVEKLVEARAGAIPALKENVADVADHSEQRQKYTAEVGAVSRSLARVLDEEFSGEAMRPMPTPLKNTKELLASLEEER